MVPVEVAIERLRNPQPGGKIWEAREYGIDLTLLIETLQRTPEERIRYAEQFAAFVREWRAATYKPHERKDHRGPGQKSR